MNNQIDRDLFVLTDTLKDPIFYVRGTNSIPIVFHFRDFTIPSDSQAYYYVKKPSGKSSFNLASQLSNTVTVDVKDQDFSELGFCHLQIQIVSGEKTLVSFDQPVVVKENYTDGQSEESKNESNVFVLQNQGIENSGKFLGIDETGNVVPRYAPGSGTGSTVSVSVSETTTGEPGTDANVENVGDSQNVKLKFTIPKGDKGEIGEDGKSAYQIWTEQEGNSGKSEEDFLLSLKGEKGNPGEDGKAATIRIGSVTTGDTAQVTNSGTETDAVFDFVIPQGGSGGGTPSDYETVKSNSKKIWIDETLSYSIESNKQDIFGAVETSKALKLQITDGSEYWDADEKAKYPDVLSMEEIRKSRFYKNMWLPNSLEMVQSYRYSADKNGQIRLYDINAQKTDLTGLMPWGLCLRAEGKEYPTSQTHFILSKFKCLGLNSETGAWEMIQESAPTASLFDIAHTSTEGHVLQVDRTDLENGFYSFVIRMPSSWVIDGEDMCFHFYPESGISSEIVKNYDKIIVTFLLKVLEEENSGIFTCSAGCDAIGSSSDVEAFFSRFNPVTTELREHCANNCLSEESELISDNLILINECLYGSTPSVQGISQATETTLGGIRAKQRTTESVEAAIDKTSGKLYVPEQSAPTQEQVSQAVENYFIENPVESIIQAGFANEQLGLKFIPGYIMTSGAIGGASEDRKITDYILCGENVEVKYCGEYNAYDVVLAVAFFDKNKKFISGEKQKVQGEIESTISPTGTEYVVLGYFPTALNYWYLSIGEPAIVKKIEETKGEIKVLDIDKLNKIYGKNLFDLSSIKDASYLDYNGAILTNEYSEIYYTSDPIYVSPNTTYTLSLANMGSVRPYCEYDKNGVYVAEGTSTPDESTPLTFTTNERTSFVIICGFKTSISRQQLEIGSSKTEYEEYTDNYPTWKNTKDIDLIKENLNMETGVEFKAILPSKLYSVNGVSLPVYFENVLMKSLNDTGDVHFTIGNRTSKLQQLLSDVPGEKPFVCTVMRGLEKLRNQDFVLNVVDKSVISGKTINILFVGDSFTDNGTYVSETKRLLESDGATVNLIGTCGTKDCKHEGLSGGIIKNTFLDNSAGVARIVDVTGVTDAPNTAYPGRTYSDDTGKQWSIRGSKINADGTGKIVVTNYTAKEEDFNSFPSSGTLTKVSEGNGDSTISYSNPIPAYYNPFINGSSGKFDMNWYLSTWEFQNPDIVVLQFTYNDIPEWATEEQLKSVTDDFVTAVKDIHDSLQNAKIIISVEPYGAINTNNDWNGKKKSVLQWVELLKETFETEQYQEYVKIAPSYACVDMENGYSDNLIAPSSRYPDIEEYSSGDGIHPSSKGMCQIADCIYPIIASFVL